MDQRWYVHSSCAFSTNHRHSRFAGSIQAAPRVDVRKFIKIGRPGYKSACSFAFVVLEAYLTNRELCAVTKQRDPHTLQNSLLFQVDYPEIAEDVEPKHRFMSAFEQKVEAPDRQWQYLLVAAEPYEVIVARNLLVIGCSTAHRDDPQTISFKISSREVDKTAGKFWTFWNKDTKTFFLQLHFKADRTEANTRPTMGFGPSANPLNPYMASVPPPPPPMLPPPTM